MAKIPFTNSLRYRDALYPSRPLRDLRDLMNSSVARYADRTAYLIKNRSGGPYLPVSYRQFRRDATAFGAALLDLGLLFESGNAASDGDVPPRKLAILSENRYEYIVSYMAILCGGGVVVPIDRELPPDEIANLLERSGAGVLIFSSRYAAKAKAATGGLDRTLVRIPMDAPKTASDAGDPDILSPETLSTRSLTLHGFKCINSGDDAYFRVHLDPKATCAIIYTSGTAGLAKGVMLSHASIAANLVGMQSYISAHGATVLSVLPMHHTYEFTCDILASMYQGCTVAICEGLRYVMRNIAECRPEVIMGVPLVFEKMHRNIMKNAERSGRYNALRRAINASVLATGMGDDARQELNPVGKLIPRRLIFRSVHAALGGRMKLFLVGGAPCNPDVIRDFNAMGIRMIQGYGMTENSPIVAMGRDRCRRDASVGFILPGMTVSIEDADENGVGEIRYKGPSVMLGYYGDPDGTAEAMRNGWLYSGDLGYFDKEGFLYLTGRKRNVIVAKNGKNIFPEEVEYCLMNSSFIKEVIVSDGASMDGRSGMDPIVFAEIYPDLEAIRHVFGPVNEEDIRKIIDREIDAVNARMAAFKRVVRFALRDAPFEKTTTKKIKRGKIINS
jgi:long-chain acyl-CoA synthetase